MKRLSVINPADESVIGTIPNHGPAEAKKAIGIAADAFERWRNTTANERAKVLKAWHALVVKNQDVISRLMMEEGGKPITQAKAETAYAASFIEWFAEEARRTDGRTFPAPVAGIQTESRQYPVGVCYAATPWNFPAAMVTRKVAPAIAAGCSVILKPSELTPFTALKLKELFDEAAGKYENVLTVLTGLPQPITEVMMESDIVRKVSFTGSTPVGAMLMTQAAQTLKRVSLELGGNAPLIVMDDADIEKAVQGLVAGKFRNSGQTCVCPNRVFVHKKVEAVFLKSLKKVVENLKIGPLNDKTADLGPLISQKAFEKVEKLQSQALKNGAKALLAGGKLKKAGFWLKPAILTGVTPKMDIYQEEIFGPVIAITSFTKLEEVLKLANGTPYGLAAYAYTASLQNAEKLKDSLHFGMVGINTTRISFAEAPFGGVKHSGFGREGGKEGIEEYLETRFVCTAS